MEHNIIVEDLPQLGVCSLCLNDGAVKSMLLAHVHNGKTEIYSEMLQKCFAIDMSLLQLGDTKHLICDSCSCRLRDCADFKEQVQQSLQSMEAAWKLNTEPKPSLRLKLEDNVFCMDGDNLNDDDDNGDDDNDDEDYIPDFKTKKEKKIKVEETPELKALKSKPKRFSSVRDMHETEQMLKAGLIPFRFRKNNPFCCSICPEIASNLDELKTHICQHTKKNIHIAFNKMMFSDSHTFYKTSTKLRCKICTADISNYDELKEHLDRCTSQRMSRKLKWNHLPFKLEKDQTDCPICKKKFLNFVSLNNHMNVHYPNYICESCGKAFASKARLRGHMRTHEEGQFPCRYCGAVFDRVTKRENHVAKEHSKSGLRYSCKRCNIALSSFYSRQKHLAEVHNEELKRYKCNMCPLRYITPGHLSSHVRRDHLNERNHKCDKCDQAFYTRNALKMHMIRHDGERIHVCVICQKSYQRKKTLREHMRIHDNDKRFVCPICGRAFTQKCTLKGHMRIHERLDKDNIMMMIQTGKKCNELPSD